MALRRLLLRLLAETAAARGRPSSAAPSAARWFACARQIGSCAAARFRAIRADGEAATTAARAFAEARARDALDYLRRAQRQAQAEVAGIGPQPWEASDWAVYAALRVLYGPNAQLSQRHGLIDHLDSRRIPFMSFAPVFRFCIPADRVSSAPEYVCPFVDVSVLPSDEYEDEKRFAELLSLVTTCAAAVLMTFAGIAISLCVDAANYMDIKGLLITGKTPEQIRETFNIENALPLEEEEDVRKWAFD